MRQTPRRERGAWSHALCEDGVGGVGGVGGGVDGEAGVTLGERSLSDAIMAIMLLMLN
jgi:hypothetical protein